MAGLEEVSKNLEWKETGIQINGEYLSNVKFADDNVLMSKSTHAYNFTVGKRNPRSGFKDEYEEN